MKKPTVVKKENVMKKIVNKVNLMAKKQIVIFIVLLKFTISYANIGVPDDTTQIHNAKNIIVGTFTIENDTIIFHINKYIKGESIENDMFYINEKSGICPTYLLGGGVKYLDYHTFIDRFKKSFWIDKTVILLGSYTNMLWKNDIYEYSIWP